MLQVFVNKIVDSMSESGLINPDDKEIYQFGMGIALLKLVHTVTMLIIGLCFGLFIETVAFIIGYSTVRAYAGGYHAKTKAGCYCISWVMIIITLLLARFVPVFYMHYLSIAIFLLAFAIIWALSPVENESKLLDALEKRRYGRIAKIILCIDTGVATFLFLSDNVRLLFVISLSLMILALMLIAGEIQITKFRKTSVSTS